MQDMVILASFCSNFEKKLLIMEMDVLKILIQNTGLPEHLVRAELEMLLKKSGLSHQQVTLDHIREMLAGYLQDVILEVKNKS